MDHKFKAFDLTALKPRWISNEGDSGEIYPGFCMPWFSEEPVIVNEEARLHRRASRVGAIGDESDFDVSNRGRRALAELWIATCENADLEKASNFEFMWRSGLPEQNEIRVHFAEVIREILNQHQCSETTISLVIPAAFGPGPREEILRKISSSFKDVQFIQRPIALALEWCNGEAARELLRSHSGSIGQKVGFICVSTACLDRWELSRVPIRVEQANGEKYLCPVLDRTGDEQTSVELPFIGLIYESSKNEAYIEGPESAYLNLISEYKKSSLKINAKRIYESANFFENLPLIGYEYQNVPTESDYSGPGKNDRSRLEILHSGIFEDQKIPFLLSHRIEDADQGIPVIDGAHGALMMLERLQEGRVPFYEAIRPLDLYVLAKNQYQDPIKAWQPLLEAMEIPAGQIYKTPEPIGGIEIKEGGSESLSLYLRRTKSFDREQTFFKDKDVHHDRSVSVPVEITAQVRPGKGLAQVNIDSVSDQPFNASFLVDELEEKEVPPLTYAWPPGSATVIVDPGTQYGLQRKIDAFSRDISRGLITSSFIDEIRNALNSWRPIWQQISTPRPQSDETDDRFLYAHVLPSSSRFHTEKSKQLSNELAECITRAFKLSQNQRIGDRDKSRKKLTRLASWLYEDCPEVVLEYVRRKLGSDPPVHASVLSCAGNCFSTESDFRCFFENLVWCIDNGFNDQSPQEWIRAYRNMSRFRVGALSLNAITKLEQEKIVDWFLDSCGKPGVRLASYCSYLAPHLLKRRRFDSEFFEEYDKALEAFSRMSRRVNGRSKISVDCAIDFLKKEANESTLEKLSSSEADH
ncbi:hypothetical protein N9P88_00330 [Planctomycetota bacterium]|nr:hypothetical protein [Planctomycetota bacterium]